MAPSGECGTGVRDFPMEPGARFPQPEADRSSHVPNGLLSPCYLEQVITVPRRGQPIASRALSWEPQSLD